MRGKLRGLYEFYDKILHLGSDHGALHGPRAQCLEHDGILLERRLPARRLSQ